MKKIFMPLLLGLSLIFPTTTATASQGGIKNTATVVMVSHTPVHSDGLIYQNDTVCFDMTPDDFGTIHLLGSRDGVTLRVWIETGWGDTCVVLSPLEAWINSPGPLHVDLEVWTIYRNKARVVGAGEFEIAG